jgi:hypothetical protein
MYKLGTNSGDVCVSMETEVRLRTILTDPIIQEYIIADMSAAFIQY